MTAAVEYVTSLLLEIAGDHRRSRKKINSAESPGARLKNNVRTATPLAFRFQTRCALPTCRRGRRVHDVMDGTLRTSLVPRLSGPQTRLESETRSELGFVTLPFFGCVIIIF